MIIRRHKSERNRKKKIGIGIITPKFEAGGESEGRQMVIAEERHEESVKTHNQTITVELTETEEMHIDVASNKIRNEAHFNMVT